MKTQRSQCMDKITALDVTGAPVTMEYVEPGMCIAFRDGSGRLLYEVDVEEMRDSASVLDWFIQVARKGWPSDDMVGKLVRMVDGLLDLQRTVCSGGANKTCNPREVIDHLNPPD